MAYKKEKYNFENNQQMHSILDRGFNNLRQSFDRKSSANNSVCSSRQSPSLRRKSDLRKVLDEMKSSSSRIETYEEPQYGYSNNMAQYINSSVSSVENRPMESPLKRQNRQKKVEMMGELDLLQRKIQNLEENFAKNGRDSSRC
jgi:hypothetical protein